MEWKISNFREAGQLYQVIQPRILTSVARSRWNTAAICDFRGKDHSLKGLSDQQFKAKAKLVCPFPQRVKCPHCAGHIHPRKLGRHYRTDCIPVQMFTVVTLTTHKTFWTSRELSDIALDAVSFKVRNNYWSSMFPWHYWRFDDHLLERVPYLEIRKFYFNCRLDQSWHIKKIMFWRRDRRDLIHEKRPCQTLALRRSGKPWDHNLTVQWIASDGKHEFLEQLGLCNCKFLNFLTFHL